MMNEKTNRTTNLQWHGLLGALLMSTIISMMVGSRPAHATSCQLGEVVYLTNPVVTVVEGGPGDPAGTVDCAGDLTPRGAARDGSW